MGILKKCLAVEKVTIEQNFSNNVKNPISISDPTGHLMEGVFRHSVPSTEAVFCHSVLLTEEALPYHSVLPTEAAGSQMNCASISDTAESPESTLSLNSGSNNHSLSITDLPLTQEKVETAYADVFQGLGKFPGDPYKLRLKPDAVPAKHRGCMFGVCLLLEFSRRLYKWSGSW